MITHYSIDIKLLNLIKMNNKSEYIFFQSFKNNKNKIIH